MSVLSSILGKIGYTRLSDGSNYYSIGNGNTSFLGGTDPLEMSLKNPVISACIEIRAKLLSQAEFYIEESNGDKNLDDDLIKLINNPNVHQSKQDFLKQFEWFKSTYGWVYQKPYAALGFTPKAIFNLKSSNIEFPKEMLNPMVWTDKDVKNYYKQKFIYKIQDEEKSIELKQVIPFYDLSNSLSDKKEGFITSPSRIESIIKQISNIGLIGDAENVMIQTNGREMFFGGQTKGGNLGISLQLDSEDKNNIERNLMNNYGFGAGKRRSIALKNEAGHKSLHIPLKDLGLHESLISNANIVREAYEVPNELYDTYMKGSTFENQKEALIGFVQNTVQGVADDLANSWTSHFGYEERPIKASFSHLPVMQHAEDKKADKLLKISTAYRNLIQAGLSNEDVNTIFMNQGIIINDE